MLQKSSKLVKEQLKGKNRTHCLPSVEDHDVNTINLTLVAGAKLGKHLWCWFLINSNWICYGPLLLGPKYKVNFVL